MKQLCEFLYKGLVLEKGFKKKVNKSIFLSVASIFTALFWTSQNLLFVREQEILMNSLPDGLSGLRILHISDLHANSQDKINVNIWEKIAELDFDIAVITGDIVDKNAYQLTPHQLYLSGLCERVPVFFCRR